MKYFIQLRKHDQPFYTLEYDIFEHELAQEWAKVFQHASGGQPVSVPSMLPQQVLVPGNATKMQTLWQQMVVNVHAVNACGGYFEQHPIAITADIDFATVDNAAMQYELNYLHQCFHAYDDMLVYHPELMLSRDAVPYLYKLNILIHKVENCYRTMRVPPREIMLCARPCREDMIDYRPPIKDPSWYRFFDQPWQNGDLILGYATTGKNLRICHLDNDTQLVRDGMVRPQIDITTETRSMFLAHQITEQNLALQRNQMQAWVKHNNLESFIDSTAPEHNFCLEARIGHLTNEITFEQALDIIDDDDVDVALAWLET
jgi:hypothetical protein